jgi:hypothetical protein
VIGFAPRLFGLIGCVALVSAPVTWLVSGEASLWLWGKLLIGVLGLSVWALVSWRALRGRSHGRRGVHALTTLQWGLASLVIGGVAVVSATRHPVVFDLTADKVHALDRQTVALLAKIPTAESLELVAVLDPVDSRRAALRGLAERLRGVRPDLTLNMFDPTHRPDQVKRFQIKPDGPRIILLAGGREERLKQATEEAFANALKRRLGDPRPVYFISGHGERPLIGDDPTGFARLARELRGEGLHIGSLDLTNEGAIPADARALVLLGIEEPLAPSEAQLLLDYLALGGRVLLALEPTSTFDLAGQLGGWGVAAAPSRVIDPSSVGSGFGSGGDAAYGQGYGNHPIVGAVAIRRLRTIFPSVRALQIVAAQAPNVSFALVAAGRQAWAESDLNSRLWQRGADEKLAPMMVVGATRNTASHAGARSDEARLIVAGDVDFLSNRGLAVSGNRVLGLNLVSWLADQVDYLELRAPQRSISRIFLSRDERSRLRIFLLDLLPLLLLTPGLAVWLRRRGLG